MWTASKVGIQNNRKLATTTDLYKYWFENNPKILQYFRNYFPKILITSELSYTVKKFWKP